MVEGGGGLRGSAGGHIAGAEDNDDDAKKAY